MTHVLAAAGTTERPQTQNSSIQGGGKRGCYKEIKPKTTHVFKICVPQLNLFAVRGLGFALIWRAWVKEQLSLPSAVCCSSFSSWQTAALHEEARGDPAREAAHGGRLAAAGHQSPSPGLPALLSSVHSRSAACRSGSIPSKLCEDRQLYFFFSLMFPARSPVSGAW